MTEWNPKDMATLDAWRVNLMKRLAEVLPAGKTVELLAQSNPAEGCVDRYVVIHGQAQAIQIKLHFPESLDAVIARVQEAIK